jgi:acetolactate synthase-1/2/3 large subunit
VTAEDAVRTGAQILCEALIRQGVEIVFGIPGGAIMPFYHALPGYADRLHHVLCRHEQGAGHAAEGYARASGRPGGCVATSGPGATNLVTLIADAWMDSTPLVAITGQVASAAIGTDAFQETDIVGITAPITKYAYQVRTPGELPRVVAEAFHLAATGRPGPVLIDVTKDAQQARAVPEWDVSLDLDTYVDFRSRHPDERALREAARLLANAECPLILAGNGIIQSGAAAELLALAERAGIPVVTTLHGLGAFPQDHPLSLGMPSMHGWVHVNRAIQACDVLLNVGSRFDDRVTGKASTFAPHAAIIHVDVDPTEIGKVVPTAVALVGDARRVLRELHELVPPREEQAWLADIRAMQQVHEPRQIYRRRTETSPLLPHDVYAGLRQAIGQRGASRVVTDVGQHQMWAAQLLDWRRPRSHITSGGSGTMGFALPAALGAALACPDETIWVVVGDGGFQMTSQELATMRQEGIDNVKIAIINNGYLGMVRQWQQLFEERCYSGTKLTSPDFVRLAEAYGVRGLTVASAWDEPGVVVIDFQVEREANVFPIVPQGNSIGEMLESAP